MGHSRQTEVFKKLLKTLPFSVFAAWELFLLVCTDKEPVTG